MPSSEPNFDAKMVDWLYDELDPSAAESFEKHLEANPAAQAEASALKRTREAFKEMSQSEPPVGLSAILMHEAAKAAEKSPSLWARFSGLFQPVFMHPAIGAMATLIIVVGVAGALYSRNGDMAVEPQASAGDSTARYLRAERAPEAEQPAAAAPIAAADMKMQDGAELAEREQDQDKNDGYRVDTASEATEEAIETATDVRRARGALARDNAEGAWGNSSGEFALDSVAPKSKGPAQGVLGGVTANAVSGGRGYSPPPPAADPQAASPTPSKKSKRARKELAGKGGGGTTKNRAKPQEKSRSLSQENKQSEDEKISWEAQKTAVLKAAAKDKRCRDAGRIANDILDKKPAYYKKKVKNSKAVSACGRYVVSETKRRAKRRSKQAATRKKAAGTPKNAKAAPRTMDAEALD